MSPEVHEGGREPGSGFFLGIPYNVEPPSWDEVREDAWQPNEPRILVPREFAWGYDLNLHALFTRLGLVERP